MEDATAADRSAAVTGGLPAWLALDGAAPTWLRASIDDLLTGWSIHAEWSAQWHQTVTRDPVRLYGAVTELIEEMSFTPRSTLLVGTDSGWTAAFCRDAPHAPSPRRMADLVPCAEVDLHWVQGGQLDLGFSYEPAPQSREEHIGRSAGRRGVRLWHEDARWHFQEYGPPLTFEDSKRYGKARRSDRLDAALLARYAGDFGIPIDQLKSYNGSAALVYPLRWPHEDDPNHREADRFGDNEPVRIRAHGDFLLRANEALADLRDTRIALARSGRT
jgi:hypothetical protein